jgi:hypothetical protein
MMLAGALSPWGSATIPGPFGGNSHDTPFESSPRAHSTSCATPSSDSVCQAWAASPPVGQPENLSAGWTQIFTPSSPPPRGGEDVAYDSRDGYILLFGGGTDTHPPNGLVCLNDTWSYHAGVWTNLSIVGPPAGCGSAMAYDPAIGSVVLVGGYTREAGRYAWRNATWEYSSGAWTRLGVQSPPAEATADLAYDPSTGTLLLYGGESPDGAILNETWVFGSGTWTELTGAKPPGVWQPSMAFDLPAGTMVLSGGMCNAGPSDCRPQSTWLFGSGGWTESNGSGPSYRMDSAAAYDPEIGSVLLFGGEALSGIAAVLGDTWVYSGGVWESLSVPGPPARAGAGTTFDPQDGYLVLFGGGNWTQNFNDTWKFAPPASHLLLSIQAQPPAVCSPSAPGCAAETVTATLILSVAVVSSVALTPEPSAVQYGPYAWIGLPTLVFVPAAGIGVETAEPVTSSCANAGRSLACPVPQLVPQPNGGLTVTAPWNSSAVYDMLDVGDSWSIALSVFVENITDGEALADACTASACPTAGSLLSIGEFSSVELTPNGGGSTVADSFGPAFLDVLPPTASSTPPSVTPPSAPPPIGNPVPVPASPVSLPHTGVPVATVVPSGGAGVSAPAVVSGLLVSILVSAGVRIQARGQRVAVPVRAGRTERTPRGVKRCRD